MIRCLNNLKLQYQTFKDFVVSLEYQNPIGMPVIVKRHMSERELKELGFREDVRIVKVIKK